MATFVPPKKNTAYTFYVGLVSQADGKLLQANPTLAAGDVKVAIDDGAPANLGTLPVVDADFTKRVKVVMSAAEINGDNISIIFSDAAGAEWCDLEINLQTVTTSQIDDLATAAAALTQANIRTAVGLASANLDTQLLTIDDFLDTEIASILADLATVLARVTAARAGYLDNLNVGGLVASQAEVLAVQNNTRVVRVVPAVIERPDAGTSTYRIELLLYDAVGNMEAPDSAPTIALVNQAGTDLSARLDSATMALVSTGRYRAIYTAAVADALEQLVWAFSVVEGGATRIYGNTSLIVDTTAVDFTAADRAKLDTLHDTRLTAGRATNLDNLDAAVSTRAPETGGNIAAIKAKTDQLVFTIANKVDAAINAAGDFAQAAADKVWSSAARTLTAFSTALAQSVWDVLESAIAVANSIGVKLKADTYQAKVSLIDDNAGTADRYVVAFFKNGEPVTTAITVPTIQVIKAADGADLIASTALTEIGATGRYRKDEATNRVVSGAAYVAVIGATIGGAARTWSQPVGRDSA